MTGMANGSKNESSHRASGGVLKIAEKVTVPFNVAVSAANKNPRGVTGLLVIVALVFSAGWLVGSKTANQGQSLHATRATTTAESLRDASIINGTPLGVRVGDVGVLEGVTISSTWIKAPPGSTDQWYMVSITFPRSDADCGRSCSQAMKYVLGSGSCFGQECVAELKDVDEGGKTNSSDIYAQCQDYENQKQKVLIEFSGRRNQAQSQYADILLVAPSI